MRYLLIFMVLFSCRTTNTTIDLEPLCLHETVERIMMAPPQKPRSEIKQGSFKGDAIYVYFENKGTTKSTVVLNSECEYICELSGDIGMANCADGLHESLKKLELIWIDPR